VIISETNYTELCFKVKSYPLHGFEPTFVYSKGRISADFVILAFRVSRVSGAQLRGSAPRPMHQY